MENARENLEKKILSSTFQVPYLATNNLETLLCCVNFITSFSKTAFSLSKVLVFATEDRQRYKLPFCVWNCLFLDAFYEKFRLSWTHFIWVRIWSASQQIRVGESNLYFENQVTFPIHILSDFKISELNRRSAKPQNDSLNLFYQISKIWHNKERNSCFSSKIFELKIPTRRLFYKIRISELFEDQSQIMYVLISIVKSVTLNCSFFYDCFMVPSKS